MPAAPFLSARRVRGPAAGSEFVAGSGHAAVMDVIGA